MPELSQAYTAAPNCIIAIDGEPIDDLADALVRAEVNIHRSRPATARITFNTTRGSPLPLQPFWTARKPCCFQAILSG
jgi:hypothetical protein